MLGGEDEDEEDIEEANKMKEGDTIVKVGAYGVEEMRQELSDRRRAHQEKMHSEQIRRNIQLAEVDKKNSKRNFRHRPRALEKPTRKDYILMLSLRVI